MNLTIQNDARKIWVGGLVIAWVVLWVLHRCVLPPDAVNDAYRRFQVALFSGFLTLGSFLLSLKVFILVQLREKLYDTKEYIHFHKEVQKSEGPLPMKRFDPLRNLSGFLIWCVLFSLATSVIHITLGFWSSAYASMTCFAASAGTLCVVFRAWWIIRRVITNWLEFLQD